jgi:threonine/homoserine/homoserine lactone efflux protein
MLRLFASMMVGSAVGFFGAVPPGPVGLTVVQHATRGNRGVAIRVGLGGATVDCAICMALALGASHVLSTLTAHAAVRAVMSAFYVALGIVVLVRELRGARSDPDPRVSRALGGASGRCYARGVLSGALNPTLVANWSLAMATLLATGVLAPGAGAGAAFAVGVGGGVFSWFALLARIVGRARSPSHGAWVRVGTLVAALALVVTGCLGAARVFTCHVSPGG